MTNVFDETVKVIMVTMYTRKECQRSDPAPSNKPGLSRRAFKANYD